MSGVVIASNLVVNSGGDDLNADSPIIGYDNVVTTSNVAATSEDPDYPIENVANPSTYLRWRAGSGSPSSDEYITVTPDTSELLDYLAVARHNFGTAQAPVSVEGRASSGDAYTELVGPVLLPNDNPVIFRWNPQGLESVRLRIQGGLVATPPDPYLAVLYVGLLLVLQRRIYVGHTPFPYGREIQTANQRSIAGHFLGRIVLSEKVGTNVELKNLTPDWYRTYFEPFLQVAKENPFFFGWRPGSYPYETGFAWLASWPKPQNQLPNGLMQIALDLEGTMV